MHVIVVGGGLIGVSSAWALVTRGHSVELFEARDKVAQETSHANGGLLSAGVSEPWNTPGVWRELIASFVNPKSPMKLHPSAIPGLASWGLRFLAQSTQARFKANALASYQLCAYSAEYTTRWVEELELDCDYRASRGQNRSVPTGNLKIFRSRESADFSLALVEMLTPLGLEAQFLHRDGVLEKEPALNSISADISCGLYYPNDTSGDARAFTEELAARLTTRGGVIHTQTTVSGLVRQAGGIRGIRVAEKEYPGDAVVVAAASASPQLMRGLGVRLPIKPVKGYSLTIDASHVQDKPRIPVNDQAMHAVVNPLGERLRIAGTAEFTRTLDRVLDPVRIDNLMDLLRATYPHIAAQVTMDHVTPWCGFRPMTTDGRPYIGGTNRAGLYVNSGHGYLGWTQAVGSALLLADLMEGRKPAVNPDLFAIGR